MISDNEETPSCEENFISLLHSKLPQYIVNCFITTGYDTLKVIREINEQKLMTLKSSLTNIFQKMTNTFTQILILACFHLVIEPELLK